MVPVLFALAEIDVTSVYNEGDGFQYQNGKLHVLRREAVRRDEAKRSCEDQGFELNLGKTQEDFINQGGACYWETTGCWMGKSYTQLYT